MCQEFLRCILNLVVKINHCKTPCCTPLPSAGNNRQVLEYDRQAFSSWAVVPVCTFVFIINIIWYQPLTSGHLSAATWFLHHPTHANLIFMCLVISDFCLFYLFVYFIRKNVSLQVWLRNSKVLLKDFSMYGRQVVRGGVYACVVKLMFFLENRDWLSAGHWCPG